MQSELAAARVVPFQIPWPRDRRLQAICAAILDQPGLSRSIEDWGDEVGASARTLIRLFQSELGLNYRQWVQQLRLADAVCRLALGEPVARVAASLGYRSASAFSAMFRRARRPAAALSASAARMSHARPARGGFQRRLSLSPEGSATIAPGRPGAAARGQPANAPLPSPTGPAMSGYRNQIAAKPVYRVTP